MERYVENCMDVENHVLEMECAAFCLSVPSKSLSALRIISSSSSHHHHIIPHPFHTVPYTPQIWVRNYQILEEHPSNAKEAHSEQKLHGSQMKTSLVEIGPRFVLNPIRIFRGSFGGQTLYQNAQFVSPNAIRAMENKNRGDYYKNRKNTEKKRKIRDELIVLPEDPLADVFA
jgi:hypothetical protein